MKMAPCSVSSFGYPRKEDEPVTTSEAYRTLIASAKTDPCFFEPWINDVFITVLHFSVAATPPRVEKRLPRMARTGSLATTAGFALPSLRQALWNKIAFQVKLYGREVH
jgi:hypothetical protein